MQLFYSGELGSLEMNFYSYAPIFYLREPLHQFFTKKLLLFSKLENLSVAPRNSSIIIEMIAIPVRQLQRKNNYSFHRHELY